MIALYYLSTFMAAFLISGAPSTIATNQVTTQLK